MITFVYNQKTCIMIPAKYVEYTSKYNLRRFVDAHRQIYSSALNEIKAGKKQSHWMWCVFPQLRGLGLAVIPSITVLLTEMKP